MQLSRWWFHYVKHLGLLTTLWRWKSHRETIDKDEGQHSLIRNATWLGLGQWPRSDVQSWPMAKTTCFGLSQWSKSIPNIWPLLNYTRLVNVVRCMFIMKISVCCFDKYLIYIWFIGYFLGTLEKMRWHVGDYLPFLVRPTSHGFVVGNVFLFPSLIIVVR